MLYIDITPNNATKPIPQPIICEKADPTLYSILRTIISGEMARHKLLPQKEVNTLTSQRITHDNFGVIMQEALKRLYGKAT